MKILHVLSVVCAMGLLAAVARADVVTLPLDQQIYGTPSAQSPTGAAIYNYVNAAVNPVSFQSDGTGAFTRENIQDPSPSWYYLMVDTRLAGKGSFDLSAPGSTISFDTRYFQDVTNTNRYGDAPVFARAYSYAADNNTLLGYKDYGIVYATQSPWKNLPYPDWTTVAVDVAGPGTITNAFDPANISRIRFYGTDWAGKQQDFVDFRNLTFSGRNVVGTAAIPEPGSMALLAMALPLLGLRRRKA